MENNNRVLAYGKAIPLQDSELLEVSGGSAKFTVNHVTVLTGNPPSDIDIVQVWD